MSDSIHSIDESRVFVLFRRIFILFSLLSCFPYPGLPSIDTFMLFFQAGILSIRTFSVMVIMCLFTTFITSPLVNLIYPKQFRVLLDNSSANNASSSSAHPTLPKRKSASGSEKKGETVVDNDDDVFVGANPEKCAKNLELLAKKAKQEASVPTVSRIGVVVDTLPQQSFLLPLLHLLAPRGTSSNTSSVLEAVSSVQPFQAGTKSSSTSSTAPNASASVMAVTAMHFIEPKATLEDEFLALNKDGQLIRIDEEATDILAALRDLHDPAVKTKPALLPLSMFCRALSASVNAFRVQGDPHAFPQVPSAN